MNTIRTNSATEDGAVVGVAKESLLEQHVTDAQEQDRNSEPPDLIRKRVLNELTGASIHVAPRVPAEGVSEITTKTLDPDKVVRTNSAY